MSPTERAIIKTLSATQGGHTLLQLVAITGYSLRQLQKHARAMASAKVLLSAISAEHHRTVYCMPDRITAVRAQCKAERIKAAADSLVAKKARQALRARKQRAEEAVARAKKKAREAAANEAALDAELEAPMVHRIVPAHLAAPLRPRGPASVWELAA